MILSGHCPSSLLQPVIKDSKSKALLLAMSRLARKAGKKVLLSKDKSLLDKFKSSLSEGAGVDWDSVRVHPALLSEKRVRLAIKQWGTCNWQLRWSALSSCRQTKVWFPNLRGKITTLIRRLNRIDLGRLIHFTTGHSYLLRHQQVLGASGSDRCRLCGVGKEDALHLWVECEIARDLVEGDSTSGAIATLGPVAWSFNQLNRFLREPLIVGLLDQVGTEHSVSSTRLGGVD